jgi:hypothetical protein
LQGVDSSATGGEETSFIILPDLTTSHYQYHNTTNLMDFKLQIHSNLFGVKCTSKVKGFKMIPQHDSWCIAVRSVPAHYGVFDHILLHINSHYDNLTKKAHRPTKGHQTDQP